MVKYFWRCETDVFLDTNYDRTPTDPCLTDLGRGLAEEQDPGAHQGFGFPCIFCLRYCAHQEKTSSDKTSSKQTLQRSSWTLQKQIMCLNSFKCLPEQQNCKKNDASVLGISNQHDLGCSCHFSWACIFPRTSEVDCGQPQTLHQYIPQQCVPSQLKIF